MVKGVSIKFQSYAETIPRLLDLINLKRELKKYDKIVLKPSLFFSENPELESKSTKKEFVEVILKYCLQNKNPVSEVFIVEGADGVETTELFDKYGYKELAEKYSVGLIDLNNAETEEITKDDFLRFDSIHYPKILKDSFVISIPKLSHDSEMEVIGSLSNMIGAFPSSYYQGFFSRRKNKIRKWPIKYSIHDISKCKIPELTIIDASEFGSILAGQPLEMDKQAVKILGLDWRNVSHIKLIDETIPVEKIEQAK